MRVLKDSSTVKPAMPTPKYRLWLSDMDIITAITHIPTVYFYKPTSTTSSTTTTTFFSLDIMKTALSQTLVHFYPLAGRLCHDENGRMEIDCNETGAVFIEAESDAEIDDFGDFKPTPELRDLVPHVDYTTHISEWPLLLVQLTVFSCGSVSLGLAVSHTIVDGQSACHFVSTWAKIARAAAGGGTYDIGVMPVLDQSPLRARDPPAKPVFEHEEFKRPPRLLGREDGEEEEERKKETTVEMFSFTSQQVNAIKEATNSVVKDGNITGPSFNFSRFESLAAHIWKSVCEARGLADNQLTRLQMSVNVRNRLRPPLPEGFFGSAIFRGIVVATSGDLVMSPVGQVAARIRESLEKWNDEYLRSVLDFLNGQEDLIQFRSGSHPLGCAHGRFFGHPNLVVTSWLGLPFYDADFGWGLPMYMGPAAMSFEGNCFILPTKEGDGSLIVALQLQTQSMQALKHLLYQGLPKANN